MSRLGFALIGFVVVCALIASFPHRTRPVEQRPPPDRLLVLMRACARDLTRVEAALDAHNYGESRRALSTLRARLDELNHVYVERARWPQGR